MSGNEENTKEERQKIQTAKYFTQKRKLCNVYNTMTNFKAFIKRLS